MEKTIKIQLENTTVILKVDDGNGEFDTEDILRIDYGNIVGELLTFPVIVNRVGILKAQVDNSVRKKKLSFDIFKADLTEHYRKSMSKMEVDAKGVKKWKAPVIDAVENAVKTDPKYKTEMESLFTVEKSAAYIDSLYWSTKSKDDKLKALSHHVPHDLEEIVEGAVNGIKIKGLKKPFSSNNQKHSKNG